MAETATADILDLRRFRTGDFGDDYERVTAAVRYLMDVCNEFDTKMIQWPNDIMTHPHLFLSSAMIYGNVTDRLEVKRHVPGSQPYFIDISAFSYSDVGNSWSLGVYGKGLKGNAVASE